MLWHEGPNSKSILKHEVECAVSKVTKTSLMFTTHNRSNYLRPLVNTKVNARLQCFIVKRRSCWLNGRQNATARWQMEMVIRLTLLKKPQWSVSLDDFYSREYWSIGIMGSHQQQLSFLFIGGSCVLNNTNSYRYADMNSDRYKHILKKLP